MHLAHLLILKTKFNLSTSFNVRDKTLLLRLPLSLHLELVTLPIHWPNCCALSKSVNMKSWSASSFHYGVLNCLVSYLGFGF